jgi:transcriptional regulator of acetoin/glycerol metabolism
MLDEHPAPPRLGPEVEAWLRAYPWPGNLRELKNVIAYACAMAGPGGVVGLAELPDALLGGEAGNAAPGAAPSSMPPEAQLLLQYLRAAGWSVSAVAHQLGVARMTVYRRMQRWGIRQPDRLPGEAGR